MGTVKNVSGTRPSCLSGEVGKVLLRVEHDRPVLSRIVIETGVILWLNLRVEQTRPSPILPNNDQLLRELLATEVRFK